MHGSTQAPYFISGLPLMVCWYLEVLDERLEVGQWYVTAGGMVQHVIAELVGLMQIRTRLGQARQHLAQDTRPKTQRG